MFYWYGIQVMWLVIGVVVGFVACALFSNDYHDAFDALSKDYNKLVGENKSLNNLLDQIQDMTKKWG